MLQFICITVSFFLVFTTFLFNFNSFHDITLFCRHWILTWLLFYSFFSLHSIDSEAEVYSNPIYVYYSYHVFKQKNCSLKQFSLYFGMDIICYRVYDISGYRSFQKNNRKVVSGDYWKWRNVWNILYVNQIVENQFRPRMKLCKLNLMKIDLRSQNIYSFLHIFFDFHWRNK